MTLSNTVYPANAAAYTGTSGVLSILGGGTLTFDAAAAAVNLRDQDGLVVKDCIDSVVIEFPAASLNALLAANADFDTDNDEWVEKPTPTDADIIKSNIGNTNDVDLYIPFADIQTYYNDGSGYNGTKNEVKSSSMQSFFTDFVTGIKETILVDGGEVLYTDETLIGSTFNGDALKSLIQNASTASASAPILLGSGGDKTNDPSGAADGNVGSTSITLTEDMLHIKALNEVLRKMMDYGYNGRDAASGVGTATGTGATGYIDSNPFIVDDVVFIEDGFSLSASVNIESEAHRVPEQAKRTTVGDIQNIGSTYNSVITKDLFLVLV